MVYRRAACGRGLRIGTGFALLWALHCYGLFELLYGGFESVGFESLKYGLRAWALNCYMGFELTGFESLWAFESHGSCLHTGKSNEINLTTVNRPQLLHGPFPLNGPSVLEHDLCEFGTGNYADAVEEQVVVQVVLGPSGPS